MGKSGKGKGAKVWCLGELMLAGMKEATGPV